MNLKMLKQPVKLAPGKGLKFKSPAQEAKKAGELDLGPTQPLHNIDVQHGDIAQPFDFKENEWLVVGDGCGSQKYFSRADRVKKAVKWGQLKLFTSELQFLNKYWDSDAIPEPIIVYVGAAPGNHINFLAQMIPQATFYLYDSQPFDARLAQRSNVRIAQRYFQQADVDTFKAFKDRLFFISDIRSLAYEKGFQGIEEYERKNEEMAMEDMNLQMKWVQELMPVKAHLKFRLPYEYKWTDKDTKYVLFLDGDLYKQPWSAPTSTEARLVPDLSLPLRNWDFRVYESMMFYHNNVIREHIKFMNPLTNINESICTELGLTQDYDSTVFVVTVRDYITKFNGDTNPESVLKLCKAIIEDVGKGVVSIVGLRSGVNNETKLYAIQRAMKEARVDNEDDE
jgi:hypothetical protein